LVDITSFKCNICGGETTIKDGCGIDGRPRFSSLLCIHCGVLIYYYDNCQWVWISKQDREEWLERKRREVDFDVKKASREHR
jgi:hypothetical protein